MRQLFRRSPDTTRFSPVTNRLEAFSDGIFSIAITLLGFQLVVPTFEASPTNGRLWSAFWDLWPNYLSFILSFVSILIMWIVHHSIFGLLARMDKLVMVTNGVLLMFVTAVPFATMIIAEYLRTDAAAMAVALYGGLFVGVNLAFNALWWTIAWRGRLLDRRADPQWVHSYSRGLLVALPLYALAALVAFWSVPVSMAILAVLWIYWGFTPFHPPIRDDA